MYVHFKNLNFQRLLPKIKEFQFMVQNCSSSPVNQLFSTGVKILFVLGGISATTE